MECKKLKKEISGLTKDIYNVLVKDEYSRGSDRILYIKLLSERDCENMPISEAMMSDSLPSFESVGRLRRKLQQAYPELLPKEEILNGRELNENYFRSLARCKSINIYG